MTSSCTVIGGGYAGIAAAIALADSSVRVTLLESRPHWGGRATSWPDPRLGDPVDNGQHVLLGCYGATRALLSRLGTAHLVRFDPGLDLVFREWGGRASRLRAPGELGRAGLALGLALWTRVPIAERVALARALRDGAAPAPGASVTAWLDALGQGATARRFFWHPITEASINETPDRAEAALLFAVVGEAFRGAPDAPALGLARAGLAELVAPIEGVLERAGGSARLQAQVRAVEPQAGSGATGFRAVLESGETLESDAMVLAVPALEALEITGDAFPALVPSLDPAAALETSPIVTATLWFDRPVMPAPVVGLVSPPHGGGPGFAWAFDRSALLGVREGRHAVVLVASAARPLVEMRSQEIADRARAALDAYGLTREVPVAFRVVKEPRATPSFRAHKGSSSAATRPGAETRVPGLALAGDWTATGLPATIEGAVRSGQAAARVVLEHARLHVQSV
ncbi:MAG: hydroxysqualene dehydroxylase HpnE [Candidatus Eiseniibacteriota bacterium]